MNKSRIHMLWRQALFGWVNLSLVAPAVYIWVGLPLVMRQHGWSGTDIGLFQLAGLPAVFKLFLALPVQQWRPGRRPYLFWSFLTGGGYLLAILGLAALDPNSHKGVLFALTLLVAMFATWADIPVNALAIHLFPTMERPMAGSVRAAATFVGAIMGGGVMLLIQERFGWYAPFLLLGGILLLALVILSSIREDTKPSLLKVQRTPPFTVWSGFFRQAGSGIWTVTLFGYLPFVAAAWLYLKPMLLDHGHPVNEVALIAGIGGGAIGALAGLVIAVVTRVKLYALLPLSAGANVISLVTLAMATACASGAWLMVSAAFLAIVMGIASSLIFALMMEFARDGWQAADYGLQASMFTLSRIMVAPLAGLLLDRFGYSAMLATLALVALLVALLIHAFWEPGISLSKEAVP